LSRAPLIPLRGTTTRLFCCPRPGPMPLHFLCRKPRTNTSNVHKKPLIPDDMVNASLADLGRLDWPGADFHAGVNFALTEF
jgi:hypothetical protein